jgi:hypothetical protein
MRKLTTSHHDYPHDDSEQPFEAVLDFFVCGSRQRPVQESETHQEHIPLDERPHGSRRSRQAGAAKSSLLHLFDPS